MVVPVAMLMNVRLCIDCLSGGTIRHGRPPYHGLAIRRLALIAGTWGYGTNGVTNALHQTVSMSKLLNCLVDLTGIEPVTSSMPWKRAPSCATGPLLGKDCFHSRPCGLLSQTPVA